MAMHVASKQDRDGDCSTGAAWPPSWLGSIFARACFPTDPLLPCMQASVDPRLLQLYSELGMESDVTVQVRRPGAPAGKLGERR